MGILGGEGGGPPSSPWICQWWPTGSFKVVKCIITSTYINWIKNFSSSDKILNTPTATEGVYWKYVLNQEWVKTGDLFDGQK